MKAENIYKVLADKIESEVAECDYLHEEPTLTIEAEVEGEKDGALIVATFEGTAEVYEYEYDSGDYWTPPYESYGIKYEGTLTWQDENENEYSENVKDKI